MNLTHKKTVLLFTFFFFSVVNIFSQTQISEDTFTYNEEEIPEDIFSVPALLSGIWSNKERYVIFDSGYSSSINSSKLNAEIPQIVLRTFYQWYNDRVAESSLYSEENKRDVNVASQKSQNEEILISFIPLTDEVFPANYELPVVQEDGDIINAENSGSGAWDLLIKYPHDKTLYHVPVCVIGDKLYLNFVIKTEDSDSAPVNPYLANSIIQAGNLLSGYWQDHGNANGILICPPVNQKELISYYITDNAVYHIRYWTTDMEYDGEAQAVFTDGNESYSVNKHLRVGDKTYTCVTGKRSKIRNIEKSLELPFDYTLNSVLVTKTAWNEETEENYTYQVRCATICALGKPYLTLTDGTKTIEEIIKIQNSKKKPLPPPLFPVHGGAVDFDFSIYDGPLNYYKKFYDRRIQSFTR